MLESLSTVITHPAGTTVLALLITLLTVNVTYKYTKKPLRVFLLLVGIMMVVFRTKPATESSIEGIAMVTTLLIPVLVVMIIMILLLDALMARVMQEETQDISRYQFAVKLDLLLVFIISIEWLPYFTQI